MRTFLILIVAVMLALPAAAQTTTASGGSLGELLFQEATKQLIQKYFGHSATSATQEGAPTGTLFEGSTIVEEVVKQVLNTVSGQTGTATDEEDDKAGKVDDDEDDGGKKKKKSKKAKKKDKGKGKGKDKKMPPGLAKKDKLPPGLQRQLENNGRLPPGLAKRDLPTELEAQLPPLQEGTERLIVDNDVVLIHQATGVVLDVLRDIVRGN